MKLAVAAVGMAVALALASPFAIGEAASSRRWSPPQPVLDAEYKRSLYPGFCARDNATEMMGALYNLALNGSRYRICW